MVYFSSASGVSGVVDAAHRGDHDQSTGRTGVGRHRRIRPRTVRAVAIAVTSRPSRAAVTTGPSGWSRGSPRSACQVSSTTSPAYVRLATTISRVATPIAQERGVAQQQPSYQRQRLQGV